MDYTSGPYTVTIPAGMTSTTFDVPINDDDIWEDSENLMLTIDPSSLPTGITRGDPGSATVTIVDDDRKEINSYCSSNCSISIKMFLSNMSSTSVVVLILAQEYTMYQC